MYICVDIGGSSIKTALSTKDGQLSAHSKLPIVDNYDDLITTLTNLLQSHRANHQIEGLAISAPGMIEPKTGFFKLVGALPFLQGHHLKTELTEQLGIPVSVENDGNCAALSEIYFGKLSHVENLAFIVVGTGIGGSVVINKKIHHGANLYAGEFGIMIQDWNNGKPIVFGHLAATIPQVEKAKNLLNDPSMDGEKLFAMADDGNEICAKIIDDFYMNLTILATNLQHTYDPEYILFGGGISQRDGFLDRLNEKADYIKNTIGPFLMRPKLALGTFKKDANLIGALANFFQDYPL